MLCGDPPPLMASEPGSFARQTIVRRVPQIIEHVIADNDYTADVVEKLGCLQREIASQPGRPLTEDAPDVAAWNRAQAAHIDRTWLELPWYLAETFFYRRLLEAVGYFQPGPNQGRDPFAALKQVQIELAIDRLAVEWDALDSAEPGVAFEALLHSCLWGNRADLSNQSVHLGVSGGLAARDERHNLLIDHTEQVRRIVMDGISQVDFVNDNTGLDLLYDLALTDFLLGRGRVKRAVCHLKAHPFYVSDAMPSDLHATIAQLGAYPEKTVRALGERLRDYLGTGHLTLESGPFWTSPRMFRDLPPDLHEALARSDLVVLKGDVNYRRLLGDRHWLHTTPLEQVASYFPAPFLVLRTLKGEIQVGLAPGQAEALAAEDPDWLINGQRGLIQFVNPANRAPE